VELSASSDDVLTRLFGVAKNERIGLGKFTETIDELWKIRG
jgi:hypothetical protein